MKTLILSLFCISLMWGAKKVVALDAAAIETIYLMEKEDSLVGIVQMMGEIKPKEKTSQLYKVGTFQHPSLERIIALKPDLVILSTYSQGIKDKLHSFKIKTMDYEVNSFEEMYAKIRELGSFFQDPQKAEQIITHFKAQLKELTKHPINKQGLFLYSSNPLMAFSNQSLIGDIFTALGVQNITNQPNLSPTAQPILSKEYILGQQIDFILFGLQIPSKEALLLEADNILRTTQAYQKGNIIAFNPYTLLRASPLMIEHIKSLHHMLSNLKD